MDKRGRAVRLIDANEVVADLTAMKEHFDAIAIDGMIRGIERQTTIDAVTVVRCKECRYGKTLCNGDKEMIACSCWNIFPRANGYCYRGRKREGDEDGK